VTIGPGEEKGSKVRTAPARAHSKTPTLERTIGKFLGLDRFDLLKGAL
jgi:hypothetical protein